MDENTSNFIDGLLNEIVDRVIKKISDNNSNWLNTIQYKVKAENIEGYIKPKDIEDFEEAVGEVVENILRNASFDTNINL